jgi:serine/threonine protein phosphatase PrpC
MLQSVLNGEPIALIDCHAKPLSLRAGDVVVLASDGLLTLAEPEIAEAIRAAGAAGPESVARTLLKRVEDRGKSSQDNCTVLAASPMSQATTASARSARTIAVAAAIAVAALAVVAGYLTWRP